MGNSLEIPVDVAEPEINITYQIREKSKMSASFHEKDAPSLSDYYKDMKT